MLRIRIHVQGDVGNSKRPAKSSVTPDLLCMGEPKRPKAQTNVSDTRALSQIDRFSLGPIEEGSKRGRDGSRGAGVLARGTRSCT